MSYLQVRTLTAVLLGWCLFFLLLAELLQAAELRPYSPPIQQQAPTVERLPKSSPNFRTEPKPVKPTNPLEAYYEQFKRDASTLTQNQKNQLIKEFSAQLDNARQGMQWEEVAHYARLLDILRKGR